MTQSLQEAEEIERRQSDLKLEDIAERRQTDPAMLIDPVSVIDTKIMRYSIIVYAVAFITGILQFAYFPNLFYFTDVLGQTPGVYIKATSSASYPWTAKPLFGYLQDSLYLAGYRSKGWFIISCIFGALVSARLYLIEPTVQSFTLFYLLLNVAVVISDVMAQGLSVIIVNLKKAKAEAIGASENHRKSEILINVEKGQKEGKKIFGNYTLLRFMVRNIGKFMGGILVNIISFNTVYGIIGCIQLGVLALLLSVPETREAKWYNPNSGNIFTLLKEFLLSIWRKEIILPFILILLFRLCPEVSESGTFILKDELKWSPASLSINSLASSLIYFVAMLYLINLAESLSFKSKIYIGSVSGALTSLLYYRFAMYEDLSYVTMFGLQIVASFFQNLNFELFMIAFIGRYSPYCPKGMESFCVAAIIAVMNFCGIQGNLFGAMVLNYYGIQKGHYAELIFPMAINYFFIIGALLLTPVLGK